MPGLGAQSLVRLSVCVALTCGLGCGGTDESIKLPAGAAGNAAAGMVSQNAGGASSGGAGGSPSAAGSNSLGGQAISDLVDQVLSSTSELCDQIEKCYPELQDSGDGTCTAPASGGRKIAFQKPGDDPALEALLAKCFSEYPDADELVKWVNCGADVGRLNAECYGSCPADGEACANAGNDAIHLCDTPAIKAQLNACYTANK